MPEETERIDLALTFGVPSFLETLRCVADDMKIEKIVLAEEIKEKNAALYQEICSAFEGTETEFVPHDKFKELTKDCKAIIRTGENTPYANIILQSACVF